MNTIQMRLLDPEDKRSKLVISIYSGDGATKGGLIEADMGFREHFRLERDMRAWCGDFISKWCIYDCDREMKRSSRVTCFEELSDEEEKEGMSRVTTYACRK